MYERSVNNGNGFSAIAIRAGVFIDKLSKAGAIAASIMIALCAVLILYEIVSRQIFNAPSKWEHETVIYLMMWFGILSQPYTLKQGAQIEVDVLTSQLDEKTRRVLALGSRIFSLFYCVLFTRYAFTMVATSYAAGERTIAYSNIILWPIKSVFFLGMLLLSLQALRMLITEYCQLRGRDVKGSFRLRDWATLLIFFACAIIGLLSVKFIGVYGLIVLLFILLFAGVPVAFSLGLTGSAGLFMLSGGSALVAIPIVGYTQLDNFVLVALPLFIFSGQIMQRGGVSRRLFNAAAAWVGHLPGGLGAAAMLSCAIFSSMTGSSAACAATIGLIAIPALIENGYSMSMACGIIAAGGTLGILIPPSNSMIIVGLITGESIGKLFMAGLVPGILMAAMLTATVVILCKRGASYKPIPKVPWKGRFIASKQALGPLALPVIILGGMYTGFFTVTEAAGIAVVAAIVITIATREARLKDMTTVLEESTKTVGMLFMIIIGALIVGMVVTKTRVAQLLVESLVTSGMPSWGFIVAIMVLCLILGMFLEGISIALIVIPIVFAALRNYDFSVIWFAVLFTINMEIGAISPPVAMNNFVIQQVARTQLAVVIKGVLPFLIVLLIGMIIMALFPQLSLWIPSRM